MSSTNQEIAQQIQTKVHFYLLGLVFTVLGLAVETAKFDGPQIATAFELLGWLSLFISAILGLLRLEGVPHGYRIFHALERLERTSTETDPAPQLSQIKTLSEGVNKKLNTKYLIHRWLFVVGIACLMISRGINPLLHLFGC